MPRFFYSFAFILVLSCASGPNKALWECVQMDQDSSATVGQHTYKLVGKTHHLISFILIREIVNQ
mgnify:CR=1 FL=1